ncbi:NB-ARC domain-containing protein [Limnohabitans sp. yimb22184]|uniref:NB-ARC domain-containing protein n=1 Tax=Limnohabitans sp. YIMB22184 TaxID=3374104 RepID=UPI003A839E84
MSSPMAIRNTCFAIISSIEDDFRTLIIAISGTDSKEAELLPSDVKDNALKRRASDLRMDSISSNVSEQDLLPYIDFADIAKILESKIASKVEAHKEWIIKIAKHLLTLTGTRNRVCHTRPLEAEDLPSLIDFAKILTIQTAPFSFNIVSQTVDRLNKEPGFVLTLQIPQFWSEKSKVHHNLPIPEFDDTGFLGRQADRLHVIKLLKSHYPVVTIVGEGGVGKTALALRCLYDLADDPSMPYDAIVWVSLKTTALTQAGVKQLTGTITSTLGLLSAVAKELGVADLNKKEETDYIDEIAEYFDLYRILVVIDNLETISAGPLRELLLRVPQGSKILITSRVGIGEFEARYPLQGLDEKTSISLFRAFAKLLGVTSLLRLDDGNIKGFCKRLFFSPLLIKWFVASVSRGAEPSSLTNRDGDTFSSAISFCFQNLFEKLGVQDREVISCLASARRPLTSAEMHFLMQDLTTHELEVALTALHNSSIVIRNKQGNEGFEYALSESTSAFVSAHAPPPRDFFQRIQNRLKELRTTLSQEALLGSRYDYDPFFVRTGNGRDERICATYLRRALDHLKKSEFSNARTQIEEAKRLTSHSAEVWRISALVEEHAKENYRAAEDYAHAVELEPNSSISRYCYGMFLMIDIDDLEEALNQFEAIEKIDKDASPVLTAKAMALNRMGRFEESAQIHERLLPTLKLRERRWRLTGADQAADCYRRWGRRYIDYKEYDSASNKLKRAISILLDSAERKDLDFKLLQKTAKVLSESFSRRELTSNTVFIEYMIATAERIHDLSTAGSIPIKTEMPWIITNQDLRQDYRDRILLLDRPIDPSQSITQAQSLQLHQIQNNEAIGTRKNGKIHNLQKRFGFIICKDDSRWFFHRDFLTSDTHWDKLETGMGVTFTIGLNSEGECAIEVSNKSI